MTFRCAVAAAALLVFALAGAVAPAAARGSRADEEFARLAARVLDEFLARRPEQATPLGIHRHDNELSPVTLASIASDRQWLARVRSELAAIPEGELSPDHALDARILAGRLERERLELEEIRRWERDPSASLELTTGAIRSVLESDDGNPCARTIHATKRLRAVPEILRAARLLLASPSRLHTEVAIERCEDALRFYRTTLRTLSSDCRDPQIQASFTVADTQAVRATQEFLEALREDVLPKAGGEFALGRERLAGLLAASEHESASLDTLLRRARASFERNEAGVRAAGERLAPGLGVRAALDSLEADAPGAADPPAAARAQIGDLRHFVIEHKLAAAPSRAEVRVREAASEPLSTSPVRAVAPGPWEAAPSHVYLNFDFATGAAGKADASRFFNRWSLAFLAAGEVAPGRYWDALARRELASNVRRAFPSAAALGGWAAYCERMMREEGFGGLDPRAELAPLVLARDRDARCVVALSLQMGEMTLESAAEFFETRCQLPRASAVREARRCAIAPEVLVESLGAQRVFALRDELRAEFGSLVSARRFNDALRRWSGVATPLARDGVSREFRLAAGKP